MLKFWSYGKHFLIFPHERDCKILIGLYKKSFHESSNHISWTKQRAVSASFFFLLFRTLMKEKWILAEKVVIVITAIISLRFKETNQTVLFTLLLQKCCWKVKLG